MTSMRPRQSTIRRMPPRLLLLAALPLLLSSSAPAQPATPPPGATQQARASAGSLSVAITVREQYLGRSGGKTVVKFVLSASKGEISSALKAQPRVYSFFIAGEAKGSDDKVAESFRVPLDVDLSSVD